MHDKVRARQRLHEQAGATRVKLGVLKKKVRRRFTLDPRLRPRRHLPGIFGEVAYWGAEPNPVSDAERAGIQAAFPPNADRRFVDLSIDFVAEITAGPHVPAT